MQDAASGYKGFMMIERCFRYLKRTQFKMTLMFHWVPRRIETHVRICVLALLIERVAEIACQQPWPQIRRQLQTLQVTKFLSLKHRFFRRNELMPELSQMLKTPVIPAPKSGLPVENLS
jgi:transposase